MINFGRWVWILIKGAPIKGAIEIKNGWTELRRKEHIRFELRLFAFCASGCWQVECDKCKGRQVSWGQNQANMEVIDESGAREK